jgi:hypothetical protein
MIRGYGPRSSSARPRARDPATVTEWLLAVQAQDLRRGARLAVRTRTAGLTADDLDRALSDERSLAVTWLNRGTLQQKQKAPKRLAKARRDRRQRGAAQAKPATDSEFHPSAGVHRCILARLACALARARAVPIAAHARTRLRRRVGSS